MSVVIIGDRKAGKTSMVRALAEHGQNVRIADSQMLVRELYNPATKVIAGTDEVNERGLVVDIDMPATGVKQLNLLWIDTPGEFWSNPQQRQDHSSAWQAIVEKVEASQALILLLPPHRTLVRNSLLQSAPSHLKPVEPLPTNEQWVYRIGWWLDFFQQHCGRVKHILIGLHKADLFCDVNAEASRWRYRPGQGGAAPWFKYSSYVSDIYFSAASQVIRNYKATTVGSRTHFFITTTEQQELLELPWLYLGPYMAYN